MEEPIKKITDMIKPAVIQYILACFELYGTLSEEDFYSKREIQIDDTIKVQVFRSILYSLIYNGTLSANEDAESLWYSIIF